MTDYLKHSLTAICTVIIVLAAGWLALWHVIARLPQGVVLRPQDRERVTYNSTSHILTVTTAKGTTKSYTRSPDILIEKNGTVIVKKHLAGLEYAPFMGIGISFDGLSLKKNGYVGLNLVNVWRFDFGPALAVGEIGVRPLLQLQYNIISNTNIMAGWWAGGTYHVAVAVRF